MTEDARLSLGPRALYPAKAFVTRSRSAAWLARTRGRLDESGVRILFYHRVSGDRDELAVTPEHFREQMEWLAAQGFRVVDVPGVVDALGDGRRTIGLSFDDGYRDVAENALPVLERLGFTATVFVATGVVDGVARFEWYDEQPPVLAWDEIRALDGGPLRFEPHTVTHPKLTALSDADAQREIVESKRVLEERLGRETSVFCYPAGVFGARERLLARDAGFTSAVSCEPGVNTRATDLLALRRRQIDARDSLLDFRAKVSGGHDTPPPLRAAYRRLRYGSNAS